MNTDANIKALLLGMTEIISEQRAELPIGCISKGVNGVYNARSVKDLANLENNVDAADGFVRDGLMVRFISSKKATKDDKFNGYRIVFELSGIYNGPYVIFAKTELEYKIYMHRDMWKVDEFEIEYRSFDEENNPSFKRKYKCVFVFDKLHGDYAALDKRTSLGHKIAFAMKSKFNEDYEAWLDGKKFNEDTEKFEEQEVK